MRTQLGVVTESVMMKTTTMNAIGMVEIVALALALIKIRILIGMTYV